MTGPSFSRPARFRQTRVLIVGCGDVGMRVARELLPRCRVLALTSQPGRAQVLRQAGLVPLLGNLDQPATLARLAGLATRVVHLAPPPGQGSEDARTRHLLQALSRRGRVRSLVYGSTTGVYGNAGGAHFNETRTVAPATPRAQRRVHAEALVRWWGRRAGVRASILRIPGIYAPDRAGGTPRARLQRGTPVLRAEDDVYTNHIHADDLARICVVALWRGSTQRVFHASDDTEMKMGDYVDFAADLYGMPRPPRITRVEAQAQLPPSLLSFMGESRRLDNTRLRRELRVRLHHATVEAGLREDEAAQRPGARR